MAGYIKLKKSNCKNCYKCIRNCPVKSISFSANQAQIVEDECILCGMCFVACPQNAKIIRDDVYKAKELLSGDSEVYVSLAPSFIANYDVSFTAMKKALMSLGFAGVEETAVGAAIVKDEYDRIVDGEKQDVVISTCCHTVNLLVQKHFPDLIPYLANVVSPMQAHCTKLKKEHPGAKTVFIGPCISKKAEAEEYPGTVDCVLTFEELSDWLAETDTVLAQEPDDDGVEKGKTRFFPTSGGILKTMLCDNDDYTYMSIDGMSSCIHAVKDIEKGNIHHCFIEMSACPGSCIGGPAMEKNHRAPVRDYITVRRFAEDAGDNDFKYDALSENELSKNLIYLASPRNMAGSRAIEEILRKMGKQKPEDELNCGSCGYNTCREKAQAVFEGKANLEMCLPFLKDKAEKFSDNILNNTPNGILILNEDMVVQQINAAAREIMNIRYASDVVGEPVVRILEPFDFIDVLSNGRDIHEKRVYLAEYKKYIEETIVYDHVYHILMCIMRDVTAEETEKEKKAELSRQTIEITDKVVEKQMRIVQEIASLLGETTAETKIALTKLKESLKDE